MKDTKNAIEWKRKLSERIEQERMKSVEIIKQFREKYRSEFPNLPLYESDLNEEEELELFDDTEENELILELIRSREKTTRFEQKQ